MLMFAKLFSYLPPRPNRVSHAVLYVCLRDLLQSLLETEFRAGCSIFLPIRAASIAAFTEVFTGRHLGHLWNTHRPSLHVSGVLIAMITTGNTRACSTFPRPFPNHMLTFQAGSSTKRAGDVTVRVYFTAPQ
ncbi:hypothetical protein PILCRDRAFT_446642 [Piloderma croceum F 1598]|uniref:Uncharacterized protein n=1 Tax=Piloderma croceum (strain F 1598) TaxID=765440 RepID=A0A0C3FWS7_PILCF|nr:hypothetical protein PILCRDRAFT_446642 [Piloderma croceum F 1598]